MINWFLPLKSNKKERFYVKCKLQHQLLRGESLMAKSTMIFTLFQKFISQVEIDGILAEFDTARKCDVSTLLNYLVGAATFEWKSLRYTSDVATEKGLKEKRTIGSLFLFLPVNLNQVLNVYPSILCSSIGHSF